jgi:hypothetical protein
MCDVIKLVDDAYCRLRYGVGVRLTWPVSSGVTGAEMERWLWQRGVRVYGRQYATRADQEYGITVRRQQVRWARVIMARALQGQPLPRPWGRGVRGVGLTGRLLEWLT